MPIYDYKCKTCEHTQEELKALYDNSPVLCEKCEEECERCCSAPTIDRKGITPLSWTGVRRTK